ncbi:MAG TPA: hypothetical protein VM262_04085 [Acidimicrobiales bacterium]|nr:hypothetical protein [Acidimicrobiales bacterium]
MGTMFKVRKVTDEERNAAVRDAVSKGLRVKITTGQGKAIATGLTGRRAAGSAVARRY